MKRYSEYKDSGVKWIGEIPGHWNLKRTAMLFSENRKKNINYEFDYALKFNYGKLVPKNEIGDVSSLKETYMAYTIINKNDIAINCLNLNYDFVSQRVAISPQKGIITSAYLIITPRQGVEAMYFNYLFKAMDSKKLFHGMGTGIRLTLSFSELKKQQIPVPPLPEQETIVTYLDSKVAKIDEYISIAEKKIAALEELKQTIIAEAVTRGIHKDVPMKDSGVKWIGMIPEHWKMNSLRSYVKLYSEKNHPEKQLLSVTREMGVIVRNTESKEENHNFIPDDLSGYKLVRKGDFVINKMKSWQGSYGVSKYEGIVSPAYYVCKLKFPYNDFFSIAIRCKSYVPFFTQYSKGIRVDQWDLSPIALKNIPFMEPPITEQQEIVNYIEAKVANINQLCQAERSQIEKLKEYKQRLISDVVTGKVKVTND